MRSPGLCPGPAKGRGPLGSIVKRRFRDVGEALGRSRRRPVAAADRHARPRRLPGDGGALLLHDARRPRRRRHQGRAARQGRPDPRRHELQAQGRRQPRLHQHEPQQALRRARPQDRRRPPSLLQARRDRRRRGRELPPRRRQAHGHRLRHAEGPQPRPDLRQHFGLRPDRPLVAAPGLRPHGPGHGGRDEHHRPPRRGPGQVRRAGGRHRLLALRPLRRAGRLYRQAEVRPGPAHRRLALRGRHRVRDLGRVGIPSARASSPAASAPPTG